MDFNLTEAAATLAAGGREGAGTPGAASAEREVTELYEARAPEMIRLAHVILGDRQRAEDIVQEAFYGLYRRWPQLSDPANAVPYLRSCVLNGCRSAMRRPRGDRPASQPPGAPRRQREALVLRFYAGLSAEEAAVAMGIGAGTVRSATSRGLASLQRMLEETS